MFNFFYYFLYVLFIKKKISLPLKIGYDYPETNTENGLTYTQDSVRNATRNRQHNVPHTGIPPHLRNQQRGGHQIGPMPQNQQNMPMNQQQQQHQQVIEHDENLSDKEIFPGNMHQQHGQMNQMGQMGQMNQMGQQQQQQQQPNQMGQMGSMGQMVRIQFFIKFILFFLKDTKLLSEVHNTLDYLWK